MSDLANQGNETPTACPDCEDPMTERGPDGCIHLTRRGTLSWMCACTTPGLDGLHWIEVPS